MIRPLVSLGALCALVLAGCATGRLAYDRQSSDARSNRRSNTPFVMVASAGEQLPAGATNPDGTVPQPVAAEIVAIDSIGAEVADIRERREMVERGLDGLENGPVATPVAEPEPEPGLAPLPEADRTKIERRVYFGTGSSRLTETAKRRLVEKAAILQYNPGRTMDIVGHADARGAEDMNQRLSERRAEAAKRFLVQRGIEAERLRAEGRGESEPALNGDGPQVWKENRRLEFYTP
jgi:outer membrane protein OmpA-like peptidoglycan-associated protein